MKIRDFVYKKKNGEVNDYSLLILNETETHLGGIDFKKLSEEEVISVKAIQEEYEGKLKPFMKSYRSFIKENIQEDKKE